MLRPPFRTTAALGSMAIGTLVAVYNMFDWRSHQYYFAQAKGSSSFVVLFYVGFVLWAWKLRDCTMPLAGSEGA